MLFLLLENLKNVAFSLRVDDPLIGHLHFWELKATAIVPLAAAKKTTPTPPKPVSGMTSLASGITQSPSTTATFESPITANGIPRSSSSSLGQGAHLAPATPVSPPAAPRPTMELQPQQTQSNAASEPEISNQALPTVTQIEHMQTTIDNEPPSAATALNDLSISSTLASNSEETNLGSTNTHLDQERTDYPQHRFSQLRPDTPSIPVRSSPPFASTPPTFEAFDSRSPLSHPTMPQNIGNKASSSFPAALGNIGSSAREEEIERSLMRAPFASEYEDTDSPRSQSTSGTPSQHYQHVLYTPPGSGRLPVSTTTPPPPATIRPGTSITAVSKPLVFSSADNILGTTPSQADLPQLISSLLSHSNVSAPHRNMILALQSHIQRLQATVAPKEMTTLNLPVARDILDSIEAILLDAFPQTSWDEKYAELWEWLASVSPSTPHVTHILAPLARLSQLPHVSHVARCRAFVCAAINRKCLDSILAALVAGSHHNTSKIGSGCLLNNEHLSSLFFKLIQELKQYHFDLTENPLDPLLAPPVPTPLSEPHSPPQSGSDPSSPEQVGDSEKPPSFKKKKKMVTINEAPPTPQSKHVPRTHSEPDPAAPVNDVPIPENPFSVTPTDSTPPSTVEEEPIPIPEEPQKEEAQQPVKLELPSWSILNSPAASRAPTAEPDEPAPSESGWRVVASYGANRMDSPSPPALDDSLEIDIPTFDLHSQHAQTLPLPGYEPDPVPEEAAPSSEKRQRSFSGNAPTWAKQIQQFPTVGSYRPNTDWLGGYDEESTPQEPYRAQPSRMTIGASPSSSSSYLASFSPGTSPSTIIGSPPARLLNTSVIADYQPTSKKSVIRDDANLSTSPHLATASSSDVVKIRALEGEEALVEDLQLYQNSKPADFFILELVAKAGLTSKNSLCGGCGDDLTVATARWCAYSGNYYCPRCHHNKKAILPARVIKQWNFKPAKVSNYAYDHLQSNWNRPVLDITNLDREQIERWRRESSLTLGLPIKIPSLPALLSRGGRSSSVSVIAHLTAMRERLVSVAEFIRSCRSGQRLLTTLAERLHLLWSSTLWSMQDLVDAKTGKLEPILRRFIDLFASHVRSCDSCSGKGFVCEICTAKDVIYPFESDTTSCPNCKALFHDSCWKSHPGKCPKCVRVRVIRGKDKPM